MQTMTLGSVEVVRVFEVKGPFAPRADIVPDAPRQVWEDNEGWLAPDFWAPEEDMFVAALQTWVLRSEGRTILVDTGIGAERLPQETEPRPDLPDLLARSGIAPDEVDLVINTHLHNDHVGWNTTHVDGRWAPTFPNATYLIPLPDNEANVSGAARSGAMSYADSIAPVLDAGQAELWSGEYRIDANLTLEAAPGHTPGSGVLRLASGSDRAVFIGDLMHSPVQILNPAHNTCFDEDPPAAARSRARILARAADEGQLVVPAHFAGAGAVEVRRDGDLFAIKNWAAYNE